MKRISAKILAWQSAAIATLVFVIMIAGVTARMSKNEILMLIPTTIVLLCIVAWQYHSQFKAAVERFSHHSSGDADGEVKESKQEESQHNPGA